MRFTPALSAGSLHANTWNVCSIACSHARIAPEAFPLEKDESYLHEKLVILTSNVSRALDIVFEVVMPSGIENNFHAILPLLLPFSCPFCIELAYDISPRSVLSKEGTCNFLIIIY